MSSIRKPWALRTSNPRLGEVHRILPDEQNVAPKDLLRDRVMIVASLADAGMVTIA